MDDRQLFIDGCSKLNIDLSGQKMEKIDMYASLLKKWQAKFNLIGPDTIPYIYSRHILDCAQIVPLIKDDDFVLDIGAGAGLPSIIIAILTDAKVHACERVGKKIQFMGEVKRQLKLGDSFIPLQEDVYKLDKNNHTYSVVTSRAFSELGNILKAGRAVLLEGGRYILLKGSNVEYEKSNTNLIKCMTVEEKDSITLAGGKILILS